MSAPAPNPYNMPQSTDTLIRLSGGNKQKLLQIAQAHPELLTATVVSAM